jgi:hypothetical protein
MFVCQKNDDGRREHVGAILQEKMASPPDDLSCFVLKKSGLLGSWNRRFLKATGLTVSIYNDDPSSGVSVAKHQFICRNMTHFAHGNPRWYFTLYYDKDNTESMDFAIDGVAAFSALKDHFAAHLVCTQSCQFISCLIALIQSTVVVEFDYFPIGR